MKNLIISLKPCLLPAILILLIFGCTHTDSGTRQKPDNVNGFSADPRSFEIINYEGRKNVIKVYGEDTQWAIVKYSLADYIGKEIIIQFSADVKRTGTEGSLNWQVNNAPYYPSVTFIENAEQGVWHNMKGKLFVTPTDDKPYLYLTNWENNAEKTIYYIAKPVVIIQESNSVKPDLTLKPLKSIYEKDFLIGNITDGTYMSGKHFDLLKHHYNAVTLTTTYPFVLAPSKDAYQWEAADRQINLMASNNFYLHGHCLVWHELAPKWMTTGTRTEVEKNLNYHITAVLAHFKGKIASWDVVNEAMRDGLSAADAAGDWKKCLRNSQNQWTQNPWYDKLGSDYIELSFRAARAADPNITLYYNDYGMEDLNKAEAVRKMIKDINDRYKKETGGGRNLIEGVGSQSHMFEFKKLNLNNVRSSLEKLITLGIEISISELDLSVISYERGSGKDTAMSRADEMAQAKFYAELFKLYREYSNYIKRVTMWGMDDGNSWISAGNPCLFDWKLNAKKAFYAVSAPDAFLAATH
jgi:endo-1,4-beta-xylanase